MNNRKPVYNNTENYFKLEALRSESTTQTHYPSLGERVQSTFIDTVLIIGLMFIFSSILEKYESTPDWIRIVLFACVFIIYEPLCTSVGCTLGNYIKGIRVRQYRDTTKRINIIQALIRYILKLLLGWISFLTINSNKEKRAIHDFAVGSVMIKV